MPAKAYASGGDKYQGSNSNVQSCESPLALNCADSQQSSFALSIRAPTSAQGVQPGCTLACSRDRSPVRDGVLGHSLLDLMHPPRRRERRRTLLSTRPEERGDDSLSLMRPGVDSPPVTRRFLRRGQEPANPSIQSQSPNWLPAAKPRVISSLRRPQRLATPRRTFGEGNYFEAD